MHKTPKTINKILIKISIILITASIGLLAGLVNSSPSANFKFQENHLKN